MLKTHCQYRILIIVILVLLLVSCNLPFLSEKTDSSVNKVAQLDDFPELAVFGELASLHGNTITRKVDEKASTVKLDEGARLIIPEGAFTSPNNMEVTRIDVAFDQVAIDASEGKYYVVNTQNDVDPLGAPIVLEVSGFSGEVNVVQYKEGQWAILQVVSEEIVRVSIDHFSKGIFGFFEWWSERDIELGETLDSMDATSMMAQTRSHIEASNEYVHAFFGVNEMGEKTEDELCAEIIDVLKEFNTPRNREIPDIGDWSTMVEFLHAGNTPKGLYYDSTQESMDEIESRLLSTAESLSPAEFLRISIAANNGNVPLGILAAHNYLKEITYQGRLAYNAGKQGNPRFGQVALHLQSWRQSDNITPAGEYDKMGPLYHIFAAMTGALWLPTRASGPGIAAAEAFLRTFRVGGDRPDTEKAAADLCGIDAAAWLRNNPPDDVVTISPETNGVEEPGYDTSGTVKIISDLHGSYCDEAEGTYAYTWQVNVMQDLGSGYYGGTIKFHNCPGGGRVLYHVVGEPQEGEEVIMLTGTKKEGYGDLNNTSPENRTFYLNLESGQLVDPPKE